MYTNVDCKRLLDYYFVVSCNDHGIAQTKKRLKLSSLATGLDKQPRHAKFALKPKIIDFYPQRGHADTPLLPWVARSSMPRGVRARTRPPPPRFFTFTGWNPDGSKIYGACLEVFEMIDIPKQTQTVYIPKTLGFISHYPYFYAFDIFLRCLWYVIPKKLSRLEDLIIHFFYDIPAPAPRKKIAYDLGKFKVLLACRNEFDVPIMELPIEVPFTQLSKDRMCTIIKLLLLERKVIFVCSMVNELTPVCELFGNLLFPLRWIHLFLPLVSRPVGKALNEYDEPFLIGLPRFVYLRDEIQNNIISNNSYIVFIDRNEIFNNGSKVLQATIPGLPDVLEQAMSDSIQSLAKILTMQEGSVSRDVTLQAFRAMFAVISKLIFLAYNCSDDSKEETKDDDSNNNDINNGVNGDNTNKSNINNKFNDNKFLKEFKSTQIFKAFIKYYKRINKDDTTLNNIYKHFKDNEGLGKHFARRGNPNQWASGFDVSHYKKDAFLINKSLMESCEKQAAVSRAAMQSKKRKYKTPPEFGLTQSTKDFLEQYIFREETKQTKKTADSPTKKKLIKYINEIFMKKLIELKGKSYKKRLDRLKKLEVKIHKTSFKNVAAGILMLNNVVVGIMKDTITQCNGDERKSVKKVIEIMKIIDSQRQESLITIENNQFNLPKIIPSTKVEYVPKRSTSLKSANDIPTQNGAFKIDEVNNIETSTNGETQSETPKPKTPNDNIQSPDIQLEQIDKNANNSNGNNNNIETNGETESKTIDDSESSDDPDDDDDDDDDDSDSDSDDSDESSDWDVGETGADDHIDDDRFDDGVTFLRAKKRFVNLAEFEIKPQERTYWRQCQKSQHILNTGIIPDISVGADIFTDSLLESWKQFQHKHRSRRRRH